MKYLVLLIVLKFITANYSISSKLINKAVFITSKFYKLETVTSVVWTDNHSDEVSDFLREFPGSVEITVLVNNNVICKNEQRDKYTQTVFITSEPREFEKLMIFINTNLRFPIKLVLVFMKPINNVADLSIFTETAWKNNLNDIVIISQSYEDVIALSTYYPYSGGVCGNIIPVMLKPGESVFPKKLNNFNKCPIRASARQYPPFVDMKIKNNSITRLNGYDGDVVKFIINSLNATLDLVEIPAFGRCLNGTVTGGFSDLVNNKSDILIPAGILTHGRYLVTQTSHVYYDADNRWIGPKRREIYQWIKVLMPFLNSLTPFLVLAFILFVIVAVIIKKFTRSQKEKQCNICFQTFALLLGQTVKHITHTRKISLLSHFFLLWIWFSLVVRIDYQGHLIESRRYQFLEPSFSLIEEAIKLVDGYGGVDDFLNYYRNTTIERDYKIIKRPNVYSNIKNIVEGGRFLLATDAFLVRKVRHSIQILNEPISRTSSCLYMRPGWPAAPTVDILVRNLVEAGFMEKIISESISERREELNYKKDSNAQPLSVSMLSACFYGICIMWVVCSVIFLLEIIFYRLRLYATTNTNKEKSNVNHCSLQKITKCRLQLGRRANIRIPSQRPGHMIQMSKKLYKCTPKAWEQKDKRAEDIIYPWVD